MNEHDIQAESRLLALEYLLANMYAQAYLQNPQTAVRDAEHGIANMLSGLDQTTIPGLTPTISDMATAELRDAVHHLLQGVREMVVDATKP